MVRRFEGRTEIWIIHDVRREVSPCVESLSQWESCSNDGGHDNNITEILKYVTWAREGYPIQPGIPKSHLPEKLPRSNPNALYCKLVSIGSQVRASYVPEGS